MALKIAAATSRTEMAPTTRAVVAEPGKCSRLLPTKKRAIAQTAKRPPVTWNAFTRGKLPQLYRGITSGLGGGFNVAGEMPTLLDNVRHVLAPRISGRP